MLAYVQGQKKPKDQKLDHDCVSAYCKVMFEV
jgi:hypothetical protein